jgi:hypothetical protein
MHFNDEDPARSKADRVRRSTADRLNEEIDRRTEANIRRYRRSSPETILQRIQWLDEEWDIERVLEVNASALALGGLALTVRAAMGRRERAARRGVALDRAGARVA